MADIRINALATTAASTASDDYIAIDGSANGTRKLSAYSPTFGGNLTVSGTGTSSVAGNLQLGSSKQLLFGGTTASYPMLAPSNQTVTAQLADGSDWADFKAKGGTFTGNLTVSGTGTFGGTNLINIPSGGSGTYGYGISNVLSGGGLKSELSYVTSTAVTQLRALAEPGSGNVFVLRTKVGGNEQDSLSVNFSGNTTLAGNLTVSGGTITSGSGTLTLNSSANTVVLQSAGTTALTLDSSQNATFAGTIKPQQAATASAPTYVKGAIYFDTTLNKLRVGGATGWETITSV